MGKLTRFACIITPMALTIASLVCLVMVFMGGLNKSSPTLSSLYFFKADTSAFTANPSIVDVPGTDIDDKLVQAFKNSAAGASMSDFYTIHLWNYCSGKKDASTGAETIEFCSPRQASYWFNPVEVWKLDGAAAGADVKLDDYIPGDLKKGLDTYAKVVKWMFALYVIALCATAAEIVIGILAIFSRWGSFVTTILSTATTLLTLAAAALATGIYVTLATTFSTVLKPYNINASVGRRMMLATWLAAVFSLAAGVFWLLSTCCGSGKGDRKDSKGKRGGQVEKAPYTYERVMGARGGEQAERGVPLRELRAGKGDRGRAYEPFRHDERV
ncbi:hypothetical protein H2201_006661 [Coniosporium apollinis]|uniref:Integral membrane protein n=1 Tax=Coniosporium apollinis TaxID=61459 RepID=A0ABQ9NQG5_9PEZI|nr:hypothetical protein H2201_006661 [Coniosporium apollinis]